jgi:predicted O-methyltransferase YrrM
MNTGKALYHFFKVSCNLEDANTQTTINEREIIKKYAANKKMAVEIGVFEGVNTLIIASELAKNGLLIGVDPFFKGKLGISYSKLITQNRLKKSKVHYKVKLLEMFSYDAALLVNEKVDFIFIDGDHSLEGIKRDWDDWSPKVKVGGVIALHDTSVPDHDPKVEELGSYLYFQSHIQFDDRFKHLEKVDSLNVLERVK